MAICYPPKHLAKLNQGQIMNKADDKILHCSKCGRSQK